MDKKESRILFKNKFNQLANFSLENLLLPQESIESSLRKEGSWGMVDIAKIPNLDLQLVGFLQDDYDFSGYELDEWGDPADDPDLLREYPFVPGYEYRVEWTKKTQDILDCIKKPASKRYGAKGDFWLMEFWQIVCRRELPELKSSLSITEGEFHLSFDSYNELVIALTAISKAMRDVGDYAPTDKDLYQSLVDFQKAESICPKINVNKPELSYFEGVYSGQLISCEKNIFSNAISYRLNISNRIFYYDDDFDFRRSFSHCEDLVVGEPVTVSFTEDKKLGSVSRWIVQPSRVVLAPIQKYRLLELAKGVLKQAVIIFLLTAFIFLVDLPKYLLAAAISIDAIFSLWGLLLLVLLGIECVLWMKWGRAAERAFRLIIVRERN